MTTALHSIYQRVVRGIPILVDNERAPFVYDIVGTTTEGCLGVCDNCGETLGGEDLLFWQEWSWSGSKNRYRPTRNLDLCAPCGEGLRAIPLGARWHPDRSVKAARRRAIRQLEACGDRDGAAALRALEKLPEVER